ncbi:polynucleotide 3'-phosphatase ZDP isoform X2 [Prosopis cineraria]|uniref:polynucleotide 3'-phosphatase ZDP isoform X2 n=1 Tax=Prosopis cineraria TaxID=364024 RepID=UPI00240F6D09|nr:polynucleotide 3'-phosphatase ZDP isoform X2 [Prosopis cineraria]
MLTIPRFFVIGNTSLPCIVSNSFRIRSFLSSTRFFCSSFENPPLMAPPSSSSSIKISAEYAKSNRSTCKKCSQKIDAKSLRLALVTKDNRGYDLVKWHHLDCFPFDSTALASPMSIEGFSSLESSDRDDIKKFLARHDKSQEVCKASEGVQDKLQESDSKSTKVHETTEDIQNEVQESVTKKRKVVIDFSASDVKNKYKDAILSPKWKAFKSVIFLEQDDGLHASSKIAAFDFDGCLAKTAVNISGADAWSLMYSSIPDKLQSLYSDGYKLVIFTNESNIERWKNKRQAAVDSKAGRLNNFITKVKVPIQVFIACGLGKSGKAVNKEDDPFRKPQPGMWHLMEQHFNSGIPIDMDQSFYVGDAAGRKDDHSDADIKFAEAIGLKFYVPEEFFDA